MVNDTNDAYKNTGLNNSNAFDIAEILTDIQKTYFGSANTDTFEVDKSKVTPRIVDSVVISSYQSLFDAMLNAPEKFDEVSKNVKRGLTNFSNDFIKGDLALDLDYYIDALSDLKQFSTGRGEVDKLASLDTLVSLKNYSTVDFNDKQIQNILVNKRAESFLKEYDEEIALPENNSIQEVSRLVSNLVEDLSETYDLVDAKIPLSYVNKVAKSASTLISLAKSYNDDSSSLESSFQKVAGFSYSDFERAKENKSDLKLNPTFGSSQIVKLGDKYAILSVSHSPKSFQTEYDLKFSSAYSEKKLIDEKGSKEFITKSEPSGFHEHFGQGYLPQKFLASYSANGNSAFSKNTDLANLANGVAQNFASIYRGSQPITSPAILNQEVIEQAQEKAKEVQIQSGDTTFNYSIK